jgi:hypothetical protein
LTFFWVGLLPSFLLLAGALSAGVVAGVSAGSVLVLVLGAAVFLKRKRPHGSPFFKLFSMAEDSDNLSHLSTHLLCKPDNCANSSFAKEHVGGRLHYERFIPENLTIGFHRLVIGDAIGSGSSGVVYAGTMDRSVQVAIKKVNSFLIKNDTESWWRESEVLCRLRHPNCVAFYGFSWEKSEFMFIQELCYNNLREAIQKSPACVLRRAIDIMLQISAGIHYVRTRS